MAEQTQISGAALGVRIYSATANLNLNLFADFLASILIPHARVMGRMSSSHNFQARRRFKKEAGSRRAIIAGIITARRLKSRKGIYYDESV